jgi:hypothetical protein
VALKHQKSKIISIELEIKDTTDTDRSASYLDLHLEIDPIKEILIGTIISGISYQLRDIYSICGCCWNVATYERKVHNVKIEIISFVVVSFLIGYGISVSQMTTDMFHLS